MMNRYTGITVLLAVAFGLSACGDEGAPPAPQPDWQLTVKVESVGESLINPGYDETTTASRSPISSVAPTQHFDKLALIVLDSETTEVIYQTELDNWSDTGNRTSVSYVEGSKRGRKTTISIAGDCLENGKDYITYAVGYQSGSYGDYRPFTGIKPGDKFSAMELVHLPEDGETEELFAGAEILHATEGKLQTRPSSDAPLENATVTLRRQVAGTFGYFTRIRANYTIDGQTYVSKYLRLVTTRANRSIILGGFRSMEDPENFNQENVINGYEPRTDYDAALEGSATDNAFTVYSIDLSKWFPATDNSQLPLDQNGDGFLDAADSNWKTDTERYPDNVIKLQSGTVYGDSYLVAVAMHQEDIDGGLPTFQLQITDKNGKVLQGWNVLLREQVMLQATRSIVSLPEKGEKRPTITTESNPETEYCFSIVRNHLYSMGDKGHDQSYGEDEPIDLSRATDLVVDVDNEWEAAGAIIFN